MSPSDSDSWLEPGPPGSTPLGADETEGLIPSWIATRGDLDAAEQANILDGLASRTWQRPTRERLLDDLAVRQLHRAMFGQVWRWAGTYRLRQLNIGVDPQRVPMCVRDLMADAQAWIAEGTGRRTRSDTDSITGWSRSTRFRTATGATLAP